MEWSQDVLQALTLPCPSMRMSSIAFVAVFVTNAQAFETPRTLHELGGAALYRFGKEIHSPGNRQENYGASIDHNGVSDDGSMFPYHKIGIRAGGITDGGI